MNRDRFNRLSDDDKFDRIFTALALIYDELKKLSEHSVVFVNHRVSGEFTDMQRDMFKEWKENVDRENEDLR